MILIRHGQSHFNVHYKRTRQDPGIVDPGLTEDGRRQIKAAANLLLDQSIERLFASPYTRTLESAAIIAEHLGLPIEIEPLVREQAAFSCDIGTRRSELVARWRQLDFSMLEEEWWHQGRESEGELLRRCSNFRASSQDHDNHDRVLVVSHWAFIRGLTGRALENGTFVSFDPSDGIDTA